LEPGTHKDIWETNEICGMLLFSERAYSTFLPPSSDRQKDFCIPNSILWAGELRCNSKEKRRTGAPGVTRTRGPQFRKLLLYPPELQAHIGSLTTEGNSAWNADRNASAFLRSPEFPDKQEFRMPLPTTK
jgi:hypothetical protein